MARKEFCIKDNILITYTDDDVCFEDQGTADAILLRNDGTVIHNNFDEKATAFYLKRIWAKNKTANWMRIRCFPMKP